MMNSKKLSAILFAMLLIALSLFAVTSCGEDTPPDAECKAHLDANKDGICDKCDYVIYVPKPDCTEHVDEDYDGYCDECDEEVPIPKYGFTITAKDMDGTRILSGVVFYIINEYDERIVLDPTDSTGSVTATAKRGTYSVYYDSETIPEGYLVYIDGQLELLEDGVVMEVNARDNTPNGTADRPFAVNNEEASEFTFGAGEEIFFILYRPAGVILVVEGTGFEVSINGAKYTPEGGKVEIDPSADDMRTAVPFSIKSGTASENVISVGVKSTAVEESGIAIESLGAPITATVLPGESVKYDYAVTEQGSFVLECSSESAGITIELIRNGVHVMLVEFDNETANSVMAEVGDTVRITIYSNLGAEDAVTFTPVFAPAVAE